MLKPGLFAAIALALPLSSAVAQMSGPPLGLCLQSVAGVVVSGDRLGLQVRQGETERTLKIGDIWQDRWVLKAVTPSEASFERGQETQRLGLNPVGQVAADTPAEPPAQIIVISAATDPALIARALELKLWDGTTLFRNMDLAQSQRFAGYLVKTADYRAANGLAPDAPVPLDDTTANAVFGYRA